MNLSTLCLIVALLCGIAEVARGARWPNVRFLALGFVFAVASVLVQGTLQTP